MFRMWPNKSSFFKTGNFRPRKESYPMTTEEDIILFESGSLINDGDVFIAKVDSIEGHRRVTLKIQEKY